MQKFSDRDISCYFVPLLIKHADRKGISKKSLFVGIEDYYDLMTNPLEWADARLVIRIFDNFIAASGGNEDSVFNAGIDITENQVSHFQLFFLKVAPLPIIFSQLSKIAETTITTSMKMAAKQTGPGEVEYVVTPNTNRSKFARSLCAYNKGCAFATLRLKGLKKLKIHEISCASHPDETKCIYKFTWSPSFHFIEKIKTTLFFRFRDQKSIIAHIEESHAKLQSQYKEILAIRDFYSHIMENMGESVLWLNRDGVIDFANKGFSLLVNAPETAIKGRRLTDYFVQDESIQSFGDLCAQCLAAPNVPVIAEFNFKTLTTAQRIGQASIVWVQSEHRAPGFLITIRDVTNSKKIEQQLFMAEDRYRTLYENSPALIVGLDLSGRFIYANPAMVEQSGYSQEELRTMHFGQLVAPNADFDVNRLLNNLITGETRLQEVHFKAKNDEWKCIALNTFSLNDDRNKLAGIGGIAVDISETKRLNEQLIKAQRMELLGQLAGGMAHDFNNLLAGISGFSTFIIRQSSEAKIVEYAQTITQGVVRASDLLKNLLAFSRGDLGTTQEFNANDIVKEVSTIMNGVVPGTITIISETMENAPLIIGSPGKINQCIMNLCMNAKDAIGTKSGTITIRVKKSDSQENYLWIQVVDTGSGIPPDILEKIFDPFFSTKQKTEGTGLGLSVVYGIVKAHNGEILVDSHPGEGTTMSIVLPTIGVVCSPTTKKVLVLDNDAIMRTYCVDILKNSGYEAVAFGDVAATTEWCRSNTACMALVQSDLVLPHLNVNEFLATVGANKPDFKCIWMSSSPAPTNHTSLNFGPFLQKPFSPTALLETLRTINS